MWAYFEKTCIGNLRIALSMNPAGDLLRIRCRNYPGLVNSTTIDWMFPWPDQALMAVANVTLRDVRYKIYVIEFVFANRNTRIINFMNYFRIQICRKNIGKT